MAIAPRCGALFCYACMEACFATYFLRAFARTFTFLTGGFSMNVSVIASTKDGYVLPVADAELHAGHAAGICYMKDDFDSILAEPAEKTERRFAGTAGSGHHSVSGHPSYNLLIEGIPKIIAMILNRYLHIPFSRGVLLADSCVVLAGLIVIGFGIGTQDGEAEGWLLSLYSLICIFVSSRVIDYVIDGASYDKLLFIIGNTHSEPLRQYIINDMERGGTYIKSSGMYSNDDKEMIFLVVSRREVAQVQRKIREIDPTLFLVITDAYDTFGEGFKPLPEKDAMLND